MYLLGNWYLILVFASLPLIMISRIYLGSHFPSDTILGAAIGVGIIFLLMLVIPYFNAWYSWGVQGLKAVVHLILGFKS
jgi:membrane-associated phospholipid phosphatase